MTKGGWGKRLIAIRGQIDRATWASTFGNGLTTWFNYETEKTAPGLDTLQILRQRHGVDLNWLATGETPPQTINYEVLAGCIEAVHIEVPTIDAESKAKLALVLYKDRMINLQKEIKDGEGGRAKSLSAATRG
jgi:hypothetical protein